jgi:hypothetical protein
MSRNIFSKMSSEELVAWEEGSNAALARQEAFASGNASAILDRWYDSPPSYEELLTIVRGLLEQKANKDKLPRIL